MPTYNCGAFIGEAIKSVKMQTYQEWELIVVDDCSTDNTESVVRQIMADDARLIYIRNDKQLGAAESRNKALRKAKGHWVAFLDSDDMWLPAKLEKQIAFMKEHSSRPYTVYEAAEDAVYDEEYTIDLSTLRPTIAFPHLPENTKTIDEITEDIKIDQVVIGSCTNGRIDDMRIAAEVLKGRHIAKGMRCIVIPATQAIYMQAMEEGLLKIFIEAGAVVSTPTCGPCLGGYMGILAEGERCVSTTNRNFVGRMGHVKSEIYLASPAVAAASAVTGKISCPCQL